MNQEIEKILYNYLSGSIQPAALLSEFEEQYIVELISHYLISGFILHANKIHDNNLVIRRHLADQQRLSVSRTILMSQDLFEVAQVLEQHSIQPTVLKGMALTLAGIHKPGVRLCRDLDLLVSEKKVNVVFNILRTLGYRYINPSTADDASFIHGKHLPAMMNDNGTIIEIHWRITDIELFAECPLTDFFFQNKIKVNDKNIFIVSHEGLIAHTLYHGIIQHKFSHGPIFLFDLAAIYRENGKKWPSSEILLESLGLKKQFRMCQLIIEKTLEDGNISTQSLSLIKDLLGDFNWSLRPTSISLLGISSRRIKLMEIYKKLVNRKNLISGIYQQPTNTFRFWRLFFLDMVRLIKQIRF